MSESPLHQAINKVDDGDVAVQVPEWANHGALNLWVRAALALLLLGFVATIAWHAADELPSERSQSEIYSSFEQRAKQASRVAANALDARQNAREKLQESRQNVLEARLDETTTPAELRQLLLQRATDLREFQESRRTYQRKLAARSAALSDVLVIRPDSEVDLVRALGLGAVALLALLGAAALLAPRRSQLLTVSRVFGAPNVAPPVGPGGPDGPDGAGGPAAPAGDPTKDSGVAQTEPALTQGVLAAAALGAGLFGIQELEGTAEILLNLALPLVPIIGALFTRSRVAARPNLSPQERTRLFGG